MTTVAFAPTWAAAHARAAAWLPADTATRPRSRASSGRVSSRFSAPRTLNEPVFWTASSLTRTAAPVRPSRVAEVRTGVRCTRPAIRAAADRTASGFTLTSSWWSQLLPDPMLERRDRGLVAPVEGPLADALGGDEPRARERLQVRAGGRLGDAELLGDEQHADAVLDQVAVALRREVRPRVLQPGKHLQPPRAGERAEDLDVRQGARRGRRPPQSPRPRPCRSGRRPPRPWRRGWRGGRSRRPGGSRSPGRRGSGRGVPGAPPAARRPSRWRDPRGRRRQGRTCGSSSGFPSRRSSWPRPRASW